MLARHVGPEKSILHCRQCHFDDRRCRLTCLANMMVVHSEISCNVKLNVYLAMEIPDCVSFISGQNSDDRVRSCEPNVFLA